MRIRCRAAERFTGRRGGASDLRRCEREIVHTCRRRSPCFGRNDRGLPSVLLDARWSWARRAHTSTEDTSSEHGHRRLRLLRQLRSADGRQGGGACSGCLRCNVRARVVHGRQRRGGGERRVPRRAAGRAAPGRHVVRQYSDGGRRRARRRLPALRRAGLVRDGVRRGRRRGGGRPQAERERARGDAAGDHHGDHAGQRGGGDGADWDRVRARRAIRRAIRRNSWARRRRPPALSGTRARASTARRRRTTSSTARGRC